MNKHEKAYRALWMTQYQSALSQRDDYQSGRICWETATNFCVSGKAPTAAAREATDPFVLSGLGDEDFPRQNKIRRS